MVVGAFITITNPEDRSDTFRECYESAIGLCGRENVIVVDGKDSWPKEFHWDVISKHFQAGYEAVNADWVIHLDTDFIFHEDDYNKVYEAINANSTSPALSFYKYQFIQPKKYNLKSRLVLAVNKKQYGDRIKFNSGGDYCQPSLDGKYLDTKDVPEAKVPFYNYEKLLKTKSQAADDVGRMDRAYFRKFNKYIYGNGDDKTALDGWINMMRGRYQKPQKEIILQEHPKVMRETIKNLTPEQFGYNGWGLI